jgi:hypothetical protein
MTVITAGKDAFVVIALPAPFWTSVKALLGWFVSCTIFGIFSTVEVTSRPLIYTLFSMPNEMMGPFGCSQIRRASGLRRPRLPVVVAENRRTP